MDQIARNYKHLFSGQLDKYMDIMRGKNRIAQRWQNRGAAVDEQFQEVERAGNGDRFANFVLDTTMAEVHPDYAWDTQKMRFKKGERAEAKRQWTKMNRRWRKLSAAERKLFIDMRKFFTAQRKELTDASLRNLTKSMPGIDQSLADDVYKALKRLGSVEKVIEAGGDTATALEEHPNTADSIERVLRAGKVRGAYFPLRRFGKYVVEYTREKKLGSFKDKKDAQAALRAWRSEHASNIANQKDAIKLRGEEYVVSVNERGVEFFETEAEGRDAERQLLGKGWNVPSGVTIKEEWGGKFDVGSTIILNQAKKKLSGLKKDQADKLGSMLDNAFIELLAESNVRKSELQRKNVRGASKEARRVFAERVFAGSYALADMETIFDQTQAMQDLRSASRSKTDTAANVKRGMIVDELYLRESHTVNDRTSSPVQDLVAQLGFLGFLAGPSYPIVNATQPFLVGLPWLGARYNPAKATGMLMQNFETMLFEVSKEIAASRAGLKRNPHQAVQNVINKLEKQGRGGTADALRAMRDLGVMDSTFIDAVSEAAKGDSGTVSRWKIFKFAASFPKVVEVLNRSVMAATAYELEMQKSGDKAKATEVAGEAVLQTQFDYTDFNKPRFFKNKFARPFLLFKMYPQGMYGLMASSVKQMVNGESLEVRKQGLATITGLAASHTVVGGVLGGLFMEPVRALMAMLEGLFGDDEEDYPFFDKQQFDINMRQNAVDLIGDERIAEIMMRGLPRAVGIDLSQRIGLHNLMMMGLQDRGQRDSVIMKTVEALGGAPMSVLMSWERALKYMAQGQYVRGIETGMPKAIRDVMGAERVRKEGLQDFKGKQFARPEQFDPMDYFVKISGFQPAEVSEIYEERYAQQGFERRMTEDRNLLIDRWRNGAATMDDILKWNAKHPEWYISPADKVRRDINQLKDEAKMGEKGYPINFKRPSINEQARF
jgi:hypothetical protein